MGEHGWVLEKPSAVFTWHRLPNWGVCLWHDTVRKEGLFVLHFLPLHLVKLIVHSQLKEDQIKLMAGN